MFGKVKCSQNVFLWIRMVFGMPIAMPEPHLASRSILKTIENRILQDFHRNQPKMLVIIGAFLSALSNAEGTLDENKCFEDHIWYLDLKSGS